MAQSNFNLKDAVNRVVQQAKKDPSSFFVGTGIRRAGEKSNNQVVKLLSKLVSAGPVGKLDPEKAANEQIAFSKLSSKEQSKRRQEQMLNAILMMHGGVQAQQTTPQQIQKIIARTTPTGITQMANQRAAGQGFLADFDQAMIKNDFLKAQQIVNSLPSNVDPNIAKSLQTVLKTTMNATSNFKPEMMKGIVKNALGMYVRQ